MINNLFLAGIFLLQAVGYATDTKHNNRYNFRHKHNDKLLCYRNINDPSPFPISCLQCKNGIDKKVCCGLPYHVSENLEEKNSIYISHLHFPVPSIDLSTGKIIDVGKCNYKYCIFQNGSIEK
jgi:hypothetical protein